MTCMMQIIIMEASPYQNVFDSSHLLLQLQNCYSQTLDFSDHAKHLTIIQKHREAFKPKPKHSKNQWNFIRWVLIKNLMTMHLLPIRKICRIMHKKLPKVLIVPMNLSSTLTNHFINLSIWTAMQLTTITKPNLILW